MIRETKLRRSINMKKSLIAMVTVLGVALVIIDIAAQILVIGWITRQQENMQKSYNAAVSGIMQFAQRQSDKAKDAYKNQDSSNFYE